MRSQMNIWKFVINYGNQAGKKTREGIYTEPEKAHEVNHRGKYFHVPGIHLSEPSPQRTPVLYQSGGSSTGMKFAAKHTECTLILAPAKGPVASYVKKLRDLLQEEGRDPKSVKIFALMTPFVGRTEEEAWSKYEELSSYVSYEGALALLSGWTGVDYSKYHPDDEIDYIETNAVKSKLKILTMSKPDTKWTLRKIANFVGVGGMGPVAVGTPEQIANTMEEWIDETDIDGF
ncbi:LLM class flavin-dependent oxidoreductase [Siminovitchia sediminis]|uniref:LLM class flavin-dependent oxidoreductase n=1 Tax=Siminovitchia sediminis TaxID=1274353 RepID=A0ABW4KED9_9BACI